VQYSEQHSEGWFQGQRNIRLFHRSWAPDGNVRAVLLIVHGLFEHSSRYAGLADYCVSQGFAVCSYDQRGHGKSGGLRGYVNKFSDFIFDLAAYYRLVRSTFPYQRIFMLGHSIGGTIATAYAADHQEDLSGLILSAPTIKPGVSVTSFSIFSARILSVLLPKLGISPIDASAISRDPGIVEAYRNDPLVYHGKIRARLGAELIDTMQKLLPVKMGKIELPILVMHGALDRLSNPEGCSLLYESVKSKDKTLKSYEGFYHEIFNEPERSRVFTDMGQWIISHLQM
jgi:alpha-beta hydrolase superfamily lysophospholipase